jgi:hypothetical protein
MIHFEYVNTSIIVECDWPVFSYAVSVPAIKKHYLQHATVDRHSHRLFFFILLFIIFINK